jgi:hypothetical protein
MLHDQHAILFSLHSIENVVIETCLDVALASTPFCVRFTPLAPGVDGSGSRLRLVGDLQGVGCLLPSTELQS